MAQGRSVGRILAAVLGLSLVVAGCGAEPPTPRPSGGAGASPSGAALGATNDAAASTDLAACKGTDLKAAISEWAGTSSKRIATLSVTSKSGVTCTLRGRPGVRLIDGKGKILLDSKDIKSIGGPKVRTGDPVVVLGPGDALSMDVEWANWCTSQPARPLTVHLVLTDRGGLLKATKAKHAGDDDAPKCTVKKGGSTVRVSAAWDGPGL
jgi:hypothetical protein